MKIFLTCWGDFKKITYFTSEASKFSNFKYSN